MDEQLERYVEGRCGKCATPRKRTNPAWLRAQRKRAGLTLRELARRLKVSAAFISQIELGLCACPPRFSEAYAALEDKK